MTQEQLAKIFKALGDDTRLQIFDMLRQGKLCACKILEKLDITQPTLSHHMKVLCDCGLVESEKEWKWTHYWLNCQVAQQVSVFVSEIPCLKNK